MQLYIGNKNYSSWSLRAWLLMTQFGMPFQEIKLRLGLAPDSPFKREISAVNPAGRVPVLVDDGFAVWDTLAITETLAERYPQHPVWPRDARARARARSVCAEMHSGFTALRSHCPMNIEASLPEVGARLMREHPEIGADLARIAAIWRELLASHGGPMLFGSFSAADAFYAPVCARIRTYGLAVPPDALDYVQRVYELPAMQAWVRDALAEHDFLEDDEPYRTRPAG